MTKTARVSASILTVLTAAGCLEFRQVGPEDITPETPPRLVNVTIEYRQPAGCENVASSCNDPVIFFGSWMRPGAEFALSPERGTFVYRGSAIGVPVNFPPHEFEVPYAIRVYDPHLVNTPTQGWTAINIRFGGELLFKFDDLGGPREHALAYVDENGFGRNIYY